MRSAVYTTVKYWAVLGYAHIKQVCDVWTQRISVASDCARTSPFFSYSQPIVSGGKKDEMVEILWRCHRISDLLVIDADMAQINFIYRGP